jgi:predicted SPOUT superfamily RNA methylase MTH1
MEKKLYVYTFLILALVVTVFIVNRIFLPEPNQKVYQNCEFIRAGMTYNEIVQIMGKPASETQNDNQVRLLYLAGGIQTEKGN